MTLYFLLYFGIFKAVPQINVDYREPIKHCTQVNRNKDWSQVFETGGFITAMLYYGLHLMFIA